MDIDNLKIEIIQRIIDSNDTFLLLKIKEILVLPTDSIELNEPQTVYETSSNKFVLNDWQKARIKKAKQQIENGEFLTEEEAEIEIQKWFEEEEKLYGQ
jgi:hypothetical protein